MHESHLEQGKSRPWKCLPSEAVLPISGGAQGHVGWGPEQPELVGCSPVHD